MRRLIAALVQRLHARALDTHIADLESMLSQQLDERETIDAAIEATTRRLLEAHEARDALPECTPARFRRAACSVHTSAPSTIEAFHVR